MLGKYLDAINTRGVILASGSKGRACVCKIMGLDIEIITSGFPEDEDWRKFSTPEEYAMFNARQKVSKITSDKVIIAADTIIVQDGQIFEKPIDRNDFIRMMRSFSGRTHTLLTAMIVKGKLLQEVFEVTELEVDELSEDAINTIGDTPSEWQSSSGGYTIEGKYGSTIFKKINGNYYNIWGLPSNTLAKCLYNEHLEYEKGCNL